MKMQIKMTLLLSIFSFFCCVGQYPSVTERAELRNDIINAKHVIFIGIDGFGSAYLQDANIPAIKQMISEGSYYTNVYNLLPGDSWTNWTSLFRGTIFKKQTGDDYPSIFTIIKNKYSDKENKKFISFFYEWATLKNLHQNEKLDEFHSHTGIDLTNKMSAYIKEFKPVFSAIVFEEADIAGHINKWGSEDYFQVLERIDSYISMIKQAVIDSGIYDDTVFVISSDHGGYGRSHYVNISKNRKIPVVFFGKGIKKGYTSSKPVSICDIAPTIAFSLNIEIPSEWTGYPLIDTFE